MLGVKLPAFGVRFLLAGTALVCALAGAAAAQSLPGVISAVLLWGVAGAWVGLRRSGRPILYGAGAGVAAAWAFTFLVWAQNLGGYFFSADQANYFEDGFDFEIVFFPIMAALIYSPIGALMGAVAGVAACVVLAILDGDWQRSRRRPRLPRERSPL